MRNTVYSNVLVQPALPYAVRNSNEATNGTTVDLAKYKNNFRSVAFVISTATITDGTHTVTVEESANDSNWTAVPAGRIQGSLPVIAAANDDTVYTVGVIPEQRYVRLVVTDATSTTGGAISAVALLSSGSDNPVARS